MCTFYCFLYKFGEKHLASLTEVATVEWLLGQPAYRRNARLFWYHGTTVLPTVVFHPCCRHDIQTTAAVFYLTSSGLSVRSSPYSRQAGVSGFCCHHLERPASPRRNDSKDLSVFPFLPRHYHMTHVITSLLPFVTTVWSPVVLAIINVM